MILTGRVKVCLEADELDEASLAWVAFLPDTLFKETILE